MSPVPRNTTTITETATITTIQQPTNLKNQTRTTATRPARATTSPPDHLRQIVPPRNAAGDANAADVAIPANRGKESAPRRPGTIGTTTIENTITILIIAATTLDTASRLDGVLLQGGGDAIYTTIEDAAAADAMAATITIILAEVDRHPVVSAILVPDPDHAIVIVIEDTIPHAPDPAVDRTPRVDLAVYRPVADAAIGPGVIHAVPPVTKGEVVPIPPSVKRARRTTKSPNRQSTSPPRIYVPFSSVLSL